MSSVCDAMPANYAMPVITQDDDVNQRSKSSSEEQSPETHPTTAQLEEFLKCLICFEPYRNPKVLSCQHTFCEACLSQWHNKCGTQSKKNVGGALCCPTCRAPTPLEGSGVGGLPSDFKVTRLAELLQQVLVRDGVERRACDICRAAGGGHRAATHFCAECSEGFCGDCRGRHFASPLLSAHHMVDLASDNPSGKLWCTRHGSKLSMYKPIRYLCRSCGSFICTICAINAHASHDVTDLDAGLTSYTAALTTHKSEIRRLQRQLASSQDQLQELQIALKAHHDDLEDKVEQHLCEQMELVLAAQYDLTERVDASLHTPRAHAVTWAVTSMRSAAHNAIQLQADVIASQMREVRARLLADLKSRYTEVAASLNTHLDTLAFQRASLESMSHYLRSLLAGRHPLELIAVYDDLKARIDSLLRSDHCLPATFSLIVFKPDEGELGLGELDSEEMEIPQFLDHANLESDTPEDEQEDAVYPNSLHMVNGAAQTEERDFVDGAGLEFLHFMDAHPPDACLDLATIAEDSNEFPVPPNCVFQRSMSDGGHIETASSEPNLVDSFTFPPPPPLEHEDEYPDDETPFHRRVSLPPRSKGWSRARRSAADMPSPRLRQVTELRNQKRLSLNLSYLEQGGQDGVVPPSTPDVGPSMPWIYQQHLRSLALDEAESALAPSDDSLGVTSPAPLTGPIDLSKVTATLVWEKTTSTLPSAKKANKRRSTNTSAITAGFCELRAPTDILFLKSGGVLVADREERCLQLLSADTALWSKVRERRQPLVTARLLAAGLLDPVCIAMAPKVRCGNSERDMVATTDTKGRCVRLIDPAGKGSCVATWGRSWFAPMFKSPSGLARTPEGRWVVSDIGRHRVTLHSPEGQCLHQLGARGKGNYGFEMPNYVTIDAHEHLIVADSGNSVVKIYDSNAQFKCRVGQSGKGALSYPLGLCVDDVGHVLVADRTNHCLQLYTLGGLHVRTFLAAQDGLTEPCALALHPGGLLAVTQLNPAAVKLYHLTL